MDRTFLSVALASLLLAASAAAEAKVVTGELDITGAVEFSSDLIDFAPAFGGTGNANIVPGSTGTFASLVGKIAVVKDIDLPPSGGVLNAITFPINAPELHFDSTSVEPGIFGSAQCALAPAVGQTCTPPGSPFSFINTLNGSTLSFEVKGNFVDTSDHNSDPTPYQGIATAQFVGRSYQQVLTSIASGETVFTSYSASFGPAPVPEASSVLMLSAGLLALGALGWRRGLGG